MIHWISYDLSQSLLRFSGLLLFILEYTLLRVWMDWTPLSVAVTKASLESYARLTVMIVLKLTVLEMAGVLMEWVQSSLHWATLWYSRFINNTISDQKLITMSTIYDMLLLLSQFEWSNYMYQILLQTFHWAVAVWLVFLLERLLVEQS